MNQPQASDGWLTQDALWLVSKTVCDKLRAHLLSQGIEGIPSSNTAVFNVLQEHGMVQPTPDGKAIWKATVISDSGWTHGFTFLKLAPSLIWDAGDRPVVFTGSVRVDDTAAAHSSDEPVNVVTSAPIHSTALPSTNTAISPADQPSDSVGDVLALLADTRPDEASTQPENTDLHSDNLIDHLHSRHQQAEGDQKPSIVRPVPSDEPLGSQFVSWLRGGIETRRLKINDAQALVHTVAGTAFVVTPGVFQRFVQENPNIAVAPRDKKLDDWAWVQKQFERLRLHKKQDNGLNIWMCEVSGPRKKRRLYGYLLLDGHTFFSDLSFDNPHLKLLTQPAMTKNETA